MFEARYSWVGEDREAVRPVITGRAHVCAEGQLLLDPDDPLRWGIRPA